MTTIQTKNDFALNLLTFLSPSPTSVDDLLLELNCTEDLIYKNLRALKEMGFAILLKAGMIRISSAGWAKAEQAAQDYFERVHGY